MPFVWTDNNFQTQIFGAFFLSVSQKKMELISILYSICYTMSLSTFGRWVAHILFNPCIGFSSIILDGVCFTTEQESSGDSVFWNKSSVSLQFMYGFTSSSAKSMPISRFLEFPPFSLTWKQSLSLANHNFFVTETGRKNQPSILTCLQAWGTRRQRLKIER